MIDIVFFEVYVHSGQLIEINNKTIRIITCFKWIFQEKPRT